MTTAAAARTQGTAADLAQIVDHQTVDVAILDVMLRLFDGHDVPAVFWANGRRRGFYKQPNLQRRVAFKAHLLGVILAGAYPFRGVLLRCGCEYRKHTCDGGGTRYICLDLDAHDGETDTHERVIAILGVCQRLRLTPLVATSKSGRGAHVFLFLNRRVTTRAANAAGRLIAAEAGIRDRCDVIPSANHFKGFGTLHALPLTPMAERGGGLILDTNLVPLRGPAVARVLQWADTWRSDARVIEALATKRVVVAPCPSDARLGHAKGTPLKAAHGTILAAVLKHHPQFRRVLAMDPAKWRGKRSSRDAYLVGYLRRQGIQAAEIARILVAVPGTKTAERGADYAIALAEAQDAIVVPPTVPLAGQPAPTRFRSRGPWVNRVVPPARYGDLVNPWWNVSTQDRLKVLRRSLIDSVLLAYLIDRYFRGPIRRRMFFASAREIGAALGYEPRRVARAVRRLAEQFPDIIRVVPGVPHPHLRIATAFYVVDPAHNDRLDWYVRPGRSQEEPLPYGHASLAVGDLRPGPEYALNSHSQPTQEAPDADAEGLRGERAGTVLPGESGLAPRTEGVVVPGPRSSVPGAGAGQPERRVPTPSRDAGAGGVRGTTVPARPAPIHRGGSRRRRRERPWRDVGSAYKIG